MRHPHLSFRGACATRTGIQKQVLSMGLDPGSASFAYVPEDGDRSPRDQPRLFARRRPFADDAVTPGGLGLIKTLAGALDKRVVFGGVVRTGRDADAHGH